MVKVPLAVTGRVAGFVAVLVEGVVMLSSCLHDGAVGRAGGGDPQTTAGPPVGCCRAAIGLVAIGSWVVPFVGPVVGLPFVWRSHRWPPPTRRVVTGLVLVARLVGFRPLMRHPDFRGLSRSLDLGVSTVVAVVGA